MISVTLLLTGNPKHLEAVLNSLDRFPELLIYNNGAGKEALDICKKFSNAKVVEGPFVGFGPTHNLASDLATNDWILSVDSDELVTVDLADEILSLQLDEEAIYSIPRRNFYQEKWIYSCGWWPDRVIRLYNRKQTRFSDAMVHEGIEKKHLKIIDLKNPFHHFSYDSIAEFLKKMQSYSDLFAAQYVGKRNSSPLKASLHAFWAFFKSYFLKRGILQGYEGYLISAYNGHTAFYKYMKLYEANNLCKTCRCPEEKGREDN